MKLRMLTDQSNADVTGSLIDKWAAEIEEKSEGQLVIEVYHDGQLYKLDQYADAFAAGSIDIAFAQFGKGWPNKIPQFTLLSSAVFETTEHALACLNGDLGTYLNQLLNEKGKVQVLGWSGAGCVDCMLNTVRPVTKPEDLKGLKLRVPNPGQMAQVEAFGGAGVVISATDMFLAVQKGTVDGVYSTAPGGAMTIKLAEVAKYFTRVAVTGLAIEHGIIMNIDVYNSLPANLQELLTSTAKVYGEQIIADTAANGDKAWDVLVSKGIELTVIPDEEVPSWRAVWAPARDEVLKQVLDQAEIDKLMAMVDKYK
jgi:C4-dicarboxylate-binding protein DctP